MNGIKAKYPDHKFIGEEETSEGKKVVLTDDPTYIIDPIDGTMNFVHSFPHSAVSIALLVNKVNKNLLPILFLFPHQSNNFNSQGDGIRNSF